MYLCFAYKSSTKPPTPCHVFFLVCPLNAAVCDLGQGSTRAFQLPRTCSTYPGSEQSYPASAGCRHRHRGFLRMWMLGFLAGRLCGLVSVVMDLVREGLWSRRAGCGRRLYGAALIGPLYASACFVAVLALTHVRDIANLCNVLQTLHVLYDDFNLLLSFATTLLWLSGSRASSNERSQRALSSHWCQNCHFY